MSEKFGIPVMLRITTRLAHSRANVIRNTARQQNELHMPVNPRQFILLPAIARRQYKALLNNQELFEEASGHSAFNTYTDGSDKRMGIITFGIAINYLLENYPDRVVPFPVLKIGQYPIPRSMVEQIYESCDELLILEEGYPVVEELIKGLLNKGKKIKGRLDGTIPRDGELNPGIVATSLGMAETKIRSASSVVVARPPSLCKGCPHIYSYNALNEALRPYSKGRVFSDIGCYTLGALEPFDAINTCVDMGASITMAKGAADAGLFPAVAVIGDSTFTHSGMTGLLDAVNDKSAITVFILDNGTTAMTGGQKSQATGKLEEICMGIGVDPEHIFILAPLQKHHEENLEIIERELLYTGVSVIIPRRECIQTATKRMKDEKKKQKHLNTSEV